MDEAEFNKKLRQLIQKIANLPDDQKKLLGTIAVNAKQKREDINKNMVNARNKLEETFANLRIVVKYLLFDLEATRRERDQFKAMINDEWSDGDKPKDYDGEQ